MYDLTHAEILGLIRWAHEVEVAQGHTAKCLDRAATAVQDNTADDLDLAAMFTTAASWIECGVTACTC